MIEEIESKESKKAHGIIYTIFGIFVLLSAITGVSLAAYTWTYSSDNANKIETGSISMSLLESTDVIDLPNALPMPDSEGMSLNEDNSFDFAVTTNMASGNGSIAYTISITKVDPTSGYTALPNNNVKLYLTYLGSTGETQVMAPKLISEIIASGNSGVLSFDSDKTSYLTHTHTSSEKTKTSKYRLRMWIDDNTAAESWDTNTKLEFKLKISVSGTLAK